MLARQDSVQPTYPRRLLSTECRAKWRLSSATVDCMCGMADATHTGDHMCTHCSSTQPRLIVAASAT